MAEINIRDTIAYDIDQVYPAFRDSLSEVAPYLPDVDSITVQERERADEETLKVVNEWRAAASEIPKVASAFIKPEMLRWIDRATWHDDRKSCDWEMEVGFLPEAVRCRGTTTYSESTEGRTEVHIKGTLEVDGKKIPGVPRLLANKIGGAVEAFVVKLITPNLKATNRAMESYLADQKSA